MPLNTEPPPTYAIIKITKIVFTNGKIDHVFAEISYPLLPITHKFRITREEIISFIRSREHVSYQNIPWTLGDDNQILPVEP
jgi:hypothetical protein